MKATLGDLKDQFDTSTIGIQTCSDAFVKLTNEATQRLLMGPERWWDVHHKAAITAINGCITWPRQMASIEAVSICGYPRTIRNEWFEFLESGYGLRCCDTCDDQLLDRGTAVTFRDIRQCFTVKITTTKPEEVGLEMGFLGWDSSGNWIRTQDSLLNWRDGYWLTIPTNQGDSITGTQQFSAGGITQIIKPLTVGSIQVADWNLTSSDTQMIGVYDFDDLRPNFRRSFIGGLSGDSNTNVTVMFKQEWVPVRYDNDFLLIANIPAMKEMMMAVKLYGQNKLDLAQAHEAVAYRLLDREAEHYLGSGAVVPLRINYQNFGAGGLVTMY